MMKSNTFLANIQLAKSLTNVQYCIVLSVLYFFLQSRKRLCIVYAQVSIYGKSWTPVLSGSCRVEHKHATPTVVTTNAIT